MIFFKLLFLCENGVYENNQDIIGFRPDFLLVDIRVRGAGKKSSENDQLTGKQ